jgi:hypothetical protein
MTPLEKKTLVRRTLADIKKLAARPLKPDGSFDPEAFNRLPQVQEAITRFREAGITREWLLNNGFIMAASPMEEKLCPSK